MATRYFYSDTVVMPTVNHAYIVDGIIPAVGQPFNNDMTRPIAQPRELLTDGIRFLKAEHPENVWHEFIPAMGRANSPKYVKNADGVSYTAYAPDGYDGQIK